MTQTALLFAGRSFLGRHLNGALCNRGLHVVATARCPKSHDTFLACDVTEREAVRQVIVACRPDLVFQCGAITPAESASPQSYYETHVLGAINVLVRRGRVRS